jgi:hypothetical protein
MKNGSLSSNGTLIVGVPFEYLQGEARCRLFGCKQSFLQIVDLVCGLLHRIVAVKANSVLLVIP